jgi:hypothetical protein
MERGNDMNAAAPASQFHEAPDQKPSNAPETTISDMRERALALARYGFSVFRAVTEGDDKKSAFKGWQEAATSDPEKVYRLWTDPMGEPEIYNIGVRTGVLLPDGRRFLVVDLDTKASKSLTQKPTSLRDA